MLGRREHRTLVDVTVPAPSPAGDTEAVMEPGPFPDCGEIVIQLVARFAGDTEAVHCAEPPLKFTGIVNGDTVPEESITFTMVTPEGDENATGDAGAGCRVEVAVPTTSALNSPLSVIPISSTSSDDGGVTPP